MNEIYRLYRYPILIGGADLNSFPNLGDDCGADPNSETDYNINNTICNEDGNIIIPYSAYVGNDFVDEGFNRYNGLAIWAIPEQGPHTINYYPMPSRRDSAYFCGTPVDEREDDDMISFHHPCLVGTNDEAIRLHNWRSSSFYGPYADNVISAGEMFKTLDYIFINNMSGHYQPDPNSLINAYGLLREINPNYKIHILGSTGHANDWLTEGDYKEVIQNITQIHQPGYEIHYLNMDEIDDFVDAQEMQRFKVI